MSDLNADAVERVATLLSGRRAAMLTTISSDGTLTARPMALPEREFDGTIWFLSEADAVKVEQIEANEHVNVAIMDGTHLSLSGRASVTDDPAIKAELWDDMMIQWFEANSPDDRSLVAVRVDVIAAEYWDVPGHPSETISLR